MGKVTISTLDKSRDEIVKKKAPPAPDDDGTGSTSTVSPPVAFPGRPSATTPPIAVPPRPNGNE